MQKGDLFTVATVAKTQKQPECPLIDDVVHVTRGSHSATRKDEILPFGTMRMGLGIVTLRETSRTEKVENT